MNEEVTWKTGLLDLALGTRNNHEMFLLLFLEESAKIPLSLT